MLKEMSLTFGVEIVNKMHGKEARTFAVCLGALGIFFSSKFGIDELCKLNGKGRRVIVQLKNTLWTISRPSFGRQIKIRCKRKFSPSNLVLGKMCRGGRGLP